ncbi:MAG: hydrogenase [Proteobacteria bacterium HN_bin10]|nr:MAG: hydrogenase [Proteobacteria bacterium HN_bin10]
MARDTTFDYARALLRLGVLLFLFGLFTGFAVPMLAMPRMALASHLEGLMNGLLLMALGLMWPRLVLGPRAQALTFALAVYGAFANWLATLISAITCAGAMMPIAAAGRTGEAAPEAIVGFLLVSLSLAMVAACVLVLWGLRRAAATRG